MSRLGIRVLRVGGEVGGGVVERALWGPFEIVGGLATNLCQ